MCLTAPRAPTKAGLIEYARWGRLTEAEKDAEMVEMEQEHLRPTEWDKMLSERCPDPCYYSHSTAGINFDCCRVCRWPAPFFWPRIRARKDEKAKQYGFIK